MSFTTLSTTSSLRVKSSMSHVEDTLFSPKPKQPPRTKDQKRKDLEKARLKASNWAKLTLYSPPPKKARFGPQEDNNDEPRDANDAKEWNTHEIRDHAENNKNPTKRFFFVLVRIMVVFLVGFMAGCASSPSSSLSSSKSYSISQINGCALRNHVQHISTQLIHYANDNAVLNNYDGEI